MNNIMPNRKIGAGPLRTIISYSHVEDEYDPDWGYYVVQIEVWDRSRLIRKERIVTDNLNISDEDKTEMGALGKYAKNELEHIEKDEDGMQEMLNKNILELIESFEKQNHSGFSGSYVIRTLHRLLEFKPLTPLTGEPDEWNAITDNIKQNKRCSSVFLNDGVPTDIDAIIVSDDGGLTWYHSTQFRKTIYFPYTPPEKPEKIYIEWLDDDHYDIITDDSERIEKLRKRKEKEKKYDMED